MKRIAFITILMVFLCYFTSAKEVQEMITDIHWLGHDCFKITGEKTIFTDPFELKQKDKADIILITHSHSDHCSPGDVKKIQTEETVIVATEDCKEKLSGTVKIIKPGESIEVHGIKIEALPAYNIDKKFHPKANGWIGYIFTVSGNRIYLAGDTDYIPEMKTFKVDIALLPVSGTYVMTADEAVKAALDIKPKIAVPMHYGAIVGSEDDAKKFADALKGQIEVVIMKKE